MQSELFAFDHLTWPEVAALPRHTPLVLPLGAGYSLEKTAEALRFPPRLGLLPAFPFGWPASGLAVAEPLLASYIANLLNSLRDDGFSQVYALTPPGVELGLGASQLRLPPAENRLAQAADLPAQADLEKVILIPIGHIEQHGYHLPLSVDTICIEAIAQGTARAAPQLAAALPVMPYGVSTHRQAFAGTLNAGGRAFEDFWLGVLNTLVGRGFTRFYLLSGHGGNSSFLVNVVKYAGEQHLQAFIATAWLYLSSPQGVAALEARRQSKIGGMGHACELETALVLHLRPDLVHMERVVDEIDFITTPSYYMDWVEGGALVANPPWEDDTRTGAYGAGSLGTPEKGRFWLEAAVQEKAGHVSEIHEQYARRMARRNGTIARP